LELAWEKPVIVFYKERLEKPQRKAFLVVKARSLENSRVEEGAKFRGSLNDFFPFMGDIDYISSKEGISDRYVLCWLDDKEDDFSKAWRRLTGFNFPAGITFITNEKGKSVMLFVGFLLMVLGCVWIIVSKMVLDLAKKK